MAYGKSSDHILSAAIELRDEQSVRKTAHSFHNSIVEAELVPRGFASNESRDVMPNDLVAITLNESSLSYTTLKDSSITPTIAEGTVHLLNEELKWPGIFHYLDSNTYALGPIFYTPAEANHGNLKLAYEHAFELVRSGQTFTLQAREDKYAKTLPDIADTLNLFYSGE